MELGSQRHGVDHDRFFIIWVVVENDDLQQAARSVRADHKVSARTRNHSQGMADYVLDVFAADAVLTGAVRDLHIDKVALSSGRVKVALSSTVAIEFQTGAHVPAQWDDRTGRGSG
jgi:hypothetical protein